MFNSLLSLNSTVHRLGYSASSILKFTEFDIRNTNDKPLLISSQDFKHMLVCTLKQNHALFFHNKKGH